MVFRFQSGDMMGQASCYWKRNTNNRTTFPAVSSVAVISLSSTNFFKVEMTFTTPEMSDDLTKPVPVGRLNTLS